MKIIDAHHHFWDPINNDHPWLRQEPMIPFRYGDYNAIRNPFMPDDYDAEASDWDVIASVTMEGEWNPSDPLGEARWMQKLVQDTTRPAAHVAQAWLDRDDLDFVLDGLSGLQFVKSVRHKPRATSNPNGESGGMADIAFQAGFVKVSNAGLMFDLQTPWWHLREALYMAELAPETPIILNHTGLPADRSASGLASWREAMIDFAKLPNAYVKISGLGLPEKTWPKQSNEMIIQQTIDIFGPERCMFASNFPVDGLCGSFNTIFSGFDAATKHLSSSEKAAVFRTTAARIYGIEEKLQ